MTFVVNFGRYFGRNFVFYSEKFTSLTFFVAVIFFLLFYFRTARVQASAWSKKVLTQTPLFLEKLQVYLIGHFQYFFWKEDIQITKIT